MSGFFYHDYMEYEDAVIDEVESLGGMSRSDAHATVEAHIEIIELGYKARITSIVCAGKILGIDHCCVG